MMKTTVRSVLQVVRMITYFTVNNDLNVKVKDLDNAASTKNPTALFFFFMKNGI